MVLLTDKSPNLSDLSEVINMGYADTFNVEIQFLWMALRP